MIPEAILRQADHRGQCVGGAVPEDQEGLERLIDALNVFHEVHGLLSDDHQIL